MCVGALLTLLLFAERCFVRRSNVGWTAQPCELTSSFGAISLQWCVLSYLFSPLVTPFCSSLHLFFHLSPRFLHSPLPTSLAFNCCTFLAQFISTWSRPPQSSSHHSIQLHPALSCLSVDISTPPSHSKSLFCRPCCSPLFSPRTRFSRPVSQAFAFFALRFDLSSPPACLHITTFCSYLRVVF